MEVVRVSKFLAKYLRHAPGRIGLTLDAAGQGAYLYLLGDVVVAGERRQLRLMTSSRSQTLASVRDGRADLPVVPYYAVHRRGEDPRVQRLLGLMQDSMRKEIPSPGW